MFSLTPERLVLDAILVAIFLLVAFPVHEFAHAWSPIGWATARRSCSGG